jgi:hypothetical protein
MFGIGGCSELHVAVGLFCQDEGAREAGKFGQIRAGSAIVEVVP